MNKGLASQMISKLLELLIDSRFDTDANLKLAIVNALSIAFNIPDIKDEVDSH